ncbi:MAG: Hpt domain-containing protein [Deltaproteobacteria bacterium]|nr:Hpt domain-containing protein [Deltaproteobacteria bacterium]
MKTEDLVDNLGLDLEDVKELLELYVGATSSDLKAMQEAIDNNDADIIHERAHSIKGASGNLGLTDFYELAKEIDDQARTNKLNGLETIFNEFAGKFQQLVQEIENSC